MLGFHDNVTTFSAFWNVTISDGASECAGETPGSDRDVVLQVIVLNGIALRCSLWRSSAT